MVSQGSSDWESLGPTVDSLTDGTDIASAAAAAGYAVPVA